MSNFTALLIGDFRRREFSRAAETFERAGQAARVHDVATALKLVDSGQLTPDLIVLACAWPGQFEHAQLYALRRRVPLARFLSVLGTWCEGETRSGSPWPGMLRTYWHHWLPHWSHDLRQFAQHHLAAWGLPQTATDDERLMLAAPGTHDGQGLILVKSASFDMADMLCQSCRQRGYGAVWMPPYREGFVAGVSAVLWDAANVDAVQLQRCREALPTVPIIALIDFPRSEEAHSARQAGVSVVLGKPLQVDDLFDELENLTAASRPADEAEDPPAVDRREVA